jgi:RNA polymerase sigma-70 factor (ECF subfamily)
VDNGEALLKQVLSLDEDALAEVFDTYYVAIYRYIYHHVRHVETAEDLAGEVFLRMLNQIHRGAGPDRHLKAWLFRIAHNLVIDESRRAVHRTHQMLTDTLPAEKTSIEDLTQQAVMTQQAYELMEQLTPKQRSIIIMRYLEGMENAEVASVLGLSIGAVKALQHRGLNALRRQFARAALQPEEITP